MSKKVAKADENRLSPLEITEYSNCHLCPRNCGVNRVKGQTGFCQMGVKPVVARAALHFWEEPCISGYENENENGNSDGNSNGSGAVFFSGCNLRCIFCQNRQISTGAAGKEITVERLAQIFLELQEKQANNINLVTAVMFIPSVAEAIKLARANGLHVPVIYNCGGYESVEALKLLDGLVDVYLPDMKYDSKENATRFSHAADYPAAATAAIDEMVRQAPEVVFDENGLIQKGVIVRHLLLPGQRLEAEKIIDKLYEKYGDQIYYSIMNQYTPVSYVTDETLKRRVTTYEYQKVIDHALDIGITKAYMQVGKTAKESFIPAFDLEGVEKEDPKDVACKPAQGTTREADKDDKDKKQTKAYTYIVECMDGTLYTGITKDVSKRMQTHAKKNHQSAKYTKAHPVKEVRMVWESTSYSLAAKLEYAIKKLRKADKLKLIEKPDEIFIELFPGLSEVADQYHSAPQLCGIILDQHLQLKNEK